MTLDGSYVELNRAATDRMRDLTARLSDDDLQLPVGEHWTSAIALAHIAFWDGRVMYVLDMTERDGKLYVPRVDAAVHEVNDLSLPFWAAIPPREAARLAIEMATALDRRLEAFPPRLLEEVYEQNGRWVLRALHRNEHLDEVEAARGV
jgi:hypothetical protein